MPEALSESIIGTRNGLTRSGPRARKTSTCSSKVPIPPMPVPIKIPTRSRLDSSMVRPACARASSVAAVANCVKRSILRASREPNEAAASKPFTSAANLVLCALASNKVMGAVPDLPASKAAQVSPIVFPSGLTHPSPLITTRFCIDSLL